MQNGKLLLVVWQQIILVDFYNKSITRKLSLRLLVNNLLNKFIYRYARNNIREIMKTKTITKTVFINSNTENMKELKTYHSRYWGEKEIPNVSPFSLLRRSPNQIKATLTFEVSEDTVELTKEELTNILSRTGREHVSNIIDEVF